MILGRMWHRSQFHLRLSFATYLLTKAAKADYEAWLIGRDMDASKKIFVATGDLVFDFELFIGGRYQCARDKS